MKSNSKRYSYRLIVVGGIIFFLIGISGFLYPYVNTIFVVNNYSYRLLSVEKVTTKDTTINPVIETLPLAADIKTEEEKIPIFLDLKKNYVHLQVNQKLESPSIPTRILITSINLEAPVISAEFDNQQVGDDYFGSWLAPDEFAAGWHPDSALLGETGNTVINGHHNINGKVFEKLSDIKVGDTIIVFAQGKEFTFTVNNTMIIQELFVDIETRKENARWLGRSEDERLTLVTCWPANTNTHRFIVVAEPLWSE